MAMQLVLAHTIPDGTLEKFIEKLPAGLKLKFVSDLLNSFLNVDSYKVGKNSFCVADGTTPDLRNGKELIFLLNKLKESAENRDIKTLISLAFEILWYFPNLPSVKKSSNICCNTFVDIADRNPKIGIDEIATVINERIETLNKDRKIDYLGKDYYGCAAAGGIFLGDSLHVFGLSDSKVLVFDNDNNCIFETIDDYTLFFYKRNAKIKEKARIEALKFGNQELIDAISGGENIWCFPLVRQILREEYRNNEYEPYSYGTFTGEDASLSFIRTGAVNLKNAKYVIGATDGCLSQVKNPYFIDELEKYTNTPEKVISLIEEIRKSNSEKSEGTMVVYKKVV